jgi:NAD(P)-dependent dehydrogenase (short-subunit alcohol dehydrogenase family)
LKPGPAWPSSCRDALAGQGYAIAVHYHTSAKEAAQTVEHLRGRGVEAVALQADLADEQAVSGLFQGEGQRGQDQDRIAELERMVGRLTMELEAAKKASAWLPSALSRDARSS